MCIPRSPPICDLIEIIVNEEVAEVATLLLTGRDERTYHAYLLFIEFEQRKCTNFFTDYLKPLLDAYDHNPKT